SGARSRARAGSSPAAAASARSTPRALASAPARRVRPPCRQSAAQRARTAARGRGRGRQIERLVYCVVDSPCCTLGTMIAGGLTNPALAGGSIGAGGMIDVQDLRRSFGQVDAVNGVTFRVAAGEIFGFLGPNGAGKTTTISMLCTLLRPGGGRAMVNGFDVAR